MLFLICGTWRSGRALPQMIGPNQVGIGTIRPLSCGVHCESPDGSVPPARSRPCGQCYRAVFKDAGAQITLASPKGGRRPLDPKSEDPRFQTDITPRFEKDADAEAQLNKTVRLESVKREDYDTVLSGRPWPNVGSRGRQKLGQADRIFRCRLTDGEEEEMGLTKVVPFLVEARPGRDLLPGQGLARSHGQGRPVDHWPEPGLFGPDCQASDQDPDGEIARLLMLPRISIPAGKPTVRADTAPSKRPVHATNETR
jgi:hypothetical protein